MPFAKNIFNSKLNKLRKVNSKNATKTPRHQKSQKAEYHCNCFGGRFFTFRSGLKI